MKKKPAESRFALCIENRDCEDLEKRKIYQTLPDEEAAREGYLRVVDESGEDYLYPESSFIVIEPTSKAQEALAEEIMHDDREVMRALANRDR
ncbi:MAG: hypothetical protein OXB94_01220 [Nitrospira sp.]|nr:hypothetical protein [Nitrospira sp.]